MLDVLTAPGSGPPAPDAPAPRPRVLLVSDLDLVAQAVRLALRRRGFDVQLTGWRGHDRVAARSADIGLFVTDSLDGGRRLDRATEVVDRERPWVAVTATRRGPSWGALLAAGYVDVVPSTTSLDGLQAHLLAALSSRPLLDQASRQVLVDVWLAVEPELRTLEHRIGRLSVRERDILDQLHTGSTVAVIATRSGVAEATVRTQVQSIFRKLQVSSQLAAVAAYATCHE